MHQQTQVDEPFETLDSATIAEAEALEPGFDIAMCKAVLRALTDMMLGFDPASQDIKGLTSRILTADRLPCDFPAPLKTIH